MQASLFMGFITTWLGAFCLCFLKGGRNKFSEWPVVIEACSRDDNNQSPICLRKLGPVLGYECVTAIWWSKVFRKNKYDAFRRSGA